MLEKLRSTIHPVREQLKAKAFLTRSRSFLSEVGLTRVSVLVIDDEDLFPPAGQEAGSLASAITAGLSYIEEKGPVGHVILVAEGIVEEFHVVLGMDFLRRHSKSQAGIVANVSLVRSVFPGLEKGPKGTSHLAWLEKSGAKQAVSVRRARQSLADEYLNSLTGLFPGVRIRVTKRT